MSKAVIVTSIKGGVGKTTVSSSTAYALAAQGYKVLAVDMDLGAGGLDIALGCENTIAPPVTDYLSGKVTLSEAVINSPFEDLYFISSPMAGASFVPITKEQLERAVSEMKRNYDFVIFDMPAGGGEYFEMLASSEQITLINVVTTDGIYAVRAAEKTVYELSGIVSPKCNIRLVINGYDLNTPSSNSEGILSLIFAVKAELLGIVPYDPDAEKYIRKGIPLSSVKKSGAGKALTNTAIRMTGKNVPVMDGIVSKRKRKKFY